MEAVPSERALDLLADALERDAAEREAFVVAASGEDELLRAEVQALLAHERAASDFLETPAFAWDDAEFCDARGELKPGDPLGDCTVVRLLGEGGMGEVYLANDNKLGRRVAVKFLKRHLGDETVWRRFHHERKVLAGLTHPNIARLYGGAFSPEGRSWLVMEYVEGERLDHYCDARGLSVSARLTLFRKVCSAVAHAHQNLVIHRDLKPANILVTAEGEPKLLDFGIAKLLDPDATAGTDLTVTMHGAMTPEYASPEQLKGEPITTATDVYSLGGILYELLAGGRPFQTDHARPDLLMRAICEQEPERPSTAGRRAAQADAGRIAGMSPDKLRRCLAGDLDNIVAKAMRKDPARRYASVSLFAEDLRRYSEGLPVAARPDTLTYRAGKFVRRNKLGVALAMLIALTLVAGFIATAWEARRAARRFEDVRQLAKSMLFEVEPRLANVAGNTAARSLLARRALEYLDSLSLEAGSDRELRRELAASYERVGDVQGNPAGANLGDLKGGLASYEKARVIRRALAAGSPHDAWARHELANNLEQTGLFLWWNSDTRRALVNYQEALMLRRALLVEQPRSVDFRRGLASVQMRIADVDTWNTQNARALDDLQEALPMLQQLLAEQPRDATAQINTARCLARIGAAYREESDYAAALDALHRAEAIMEPLVGREPDNWYAQVQYIYELTTENEAYNEQNTPETTAQALVLSPRLIVIMEALISKDAEDTTMQHNLSIAHYDFGTALLHAERWQEALEQMQKGLSIEERFAARSPENAEYLHSRSYFHTGMGEARRHLGQLETAAGDAETARQCTESLVSKDPDNAQTQRDLVTILILRGRIEAQREQPAEARHSFQQALATLERLIANKITNKDDAEDAKFLRRALAGTKQ